METSDLIKQELDNISPIVAAIGNRSLFKVPVGYFEQLPNDITTQINQSLNIVSNEFDSAKANNFTAPDDYFNSFANSILEKAKTSEISNDITLGTKANVFAVPNNYFENNIKELEKITMFGNKTKVILFSKTQSIRLAIAASFAALIIGGMFVFNSNEVKTSTQTAITAQDINAYLQVNADDLDEIQISSLETKTTPTSNIIEQERQELNEYLESEVDEEILSETIQLN
jgi:hypothetical protein